MGHMHNTGQAVNRTFDICRVHSGKRMGMPPARRRSSNRRELFTKCIRKEANHTQNRIAGVPETLRVMSSLAEAITLCARMSPERMLGLDRLSEQEFAGDAWVLDGGPVAPISVGRN
jgi:hypothetical protein